MTSLAQPISHWWPGNETSNDFLVPRVTLTGRGSTSRVGEALTARLGLPSGSPALLAVDDAVRDAGLLDPLLRGLEHSGFHVTPVSGFGSEPDETRIDEVAAFARAASVDLVIGAGGGSVMDAAKLLALLVRNEGRARDWTGAVEPPRGVAPLVLIPSTCGTGSEVTRAAMVTVEGSKRASACAQFIPQMVALDPALLDSLPGAIVAATGMDALSHAVESMMSLDKSPLSIHHALRAIELLVRFLEPAVAGDPEARSACLWASHLAGLSLSAGVLLGHSMAYTVAHARPMPHGVACSLALPYCMAYNSSALDADTARALALALTGDDPSLSGAAHAVEAMARRLGMPTTLDAASISPGTEAELAGQCVAEYPRSNNPSPLDAARLTVLFEAMRQGDIDAAFAVPESVTVRDRPYR